MFVNFLPNKKQKDDLKHWYFYFSGELKKLLNISIMLITFNP